MLGYDPRESGPHLAAGVAAGVTATGANVEVVGIIPTPGLAYLTRESNAAAGVMITASHNPHTDNGIKVFDRNGGKLTDDTETHVNNLMVNGAPSRGNFGRWTPTAGRASEYADFLVNSAEGARFDDMTLVVDTANGAASGIAEQVFSRLGANVIPQADRPDGRNINLECGAPHLLEEGARATSATALQRSVTRHGADMGIAFDGDADRTILTDEYGRVVDGDHLMYILAKSQGLEGVVATVMSNLGTEKAMQKNGIDMVRAKVGDRYVLDGLRETGYRLGGEQSGHIILPEILATGDGMLAAIQTVRAVRESGRSLAEWRDEVDLLPQTLINIKGYDKALLEDPKVKEYLERVAADMGDAGRLLVRPSGTERKIRVMVESPFAEEAAIATVSGLQKLFDELVTA